MNDEAASGQHDLVVIGNAIVDILAYKNEAFLSAHGLQKGTMRLIDFQQSRAIYAEMGAATECSGGSAANTLAGYCLLGGTGAFIGKVKDDQFGTTFRKDLERSGAVFLTPPAPVEDPTACCLVMVTEEPAKFGGPPKIERTMATYLGASSHITKDDLDTDAIANAKALFFEGYLWDSNSAREAITEALKIARPKGVKTSFTLSDPLCVSRHKEDFLDLVSNHIDILFANEREIETLMGETDIRKVLYKLGGKCEVAVITRSEKGSYVLANDHIYTIDPQKVEHVYDVTGAGDLYAAGFLYGFLQDYDLRKCGKLASLCASEVIQYLGGRPVTKLPDLLEQL